MVGFLLGRGTVYPGKMYPNDVGVEKLFVVYSCLHCVKKLWNQFHNYNILLAMKEI